RRHRVPCPRTAARGPRAGAGIGRPRLPPAAARAPDPGRRRRRHRHLPDDAGEHAGRPVHLRARPRDRHAHRHRPVRRRGGPPLGGRRGLAAAAGARALRGACANAEDPGADRTHVEDRQAAEELIEMAKQVQDAYIVAATRTPVGKAPRGVFRNTRPDEMLAHVLRSVVAQAPGIDVSRIQDAIIGCAMPEAEQGMNVARIGALLAGLPNSIPAQTINRFGSSGLQAVALAADQVRLGQADLALARGTESMSMVPMMGNKNAMSPQVFARQENNAIAYGKGITAEKGAEEWNVSREDQDAFALASHEKALAAIRRGDFRDEISPLEVLARTPDLAGNAVRLQQTLVDTDEGPRPDTSLEGLARLRPVFRDG